MFIATRELVIDGQVVPEGAKVENPSSRMIELGVVTRVSGEANKAEELLFEKSADVAVEKEVEEVVEEVPAEEPAPAQPSKRRRRR